MSNDDSSSALSDPGGEPSIAQPDSALNSNVSFVIKPHSESDSRLLDDELCPELPSAEQSGPPPQEIPKNHVLSPNPFVDTFAILMLLLQFPTWLTIIIHSLFILALSPTFNWRDLTRPFVSIASVFTSFLSSSTQNASSSSQPSGGLPAQSSSSKASSPTKNQPSLFRVLIIDFLCAITTLYLTPILRNVVLVFAHAIVASSLGGGQRTFLHAIYATSIIETVSFFWDIICEFLHLDHTYSDFVTSAGPRLLRYSLPQHLGQPTITSSTTFSVILDDSTQSFNTLTSVFMFFPTIFRFICHIDWYSEFPTLLVQMIAVYVIWLGLSPFLRGELASSLSSDSFPEPLPPINVSGQPVNGGATLSGPVMGTGSGATPDFGDFDESINFGTTYTEDGVRDVVVISVPKEAANHSSELDDASLGNMNNSNSLNFLYSAQGKRNKKTAIVRANQPLWSMLASSIVMAARQEHMPNGAALPHETYDAILRDHPISGEGAGPSGCYASFVLEKAVGFFVTGAFTSSPDSYIVRVNQVQWRQTVIKSVNVGEESISVKPDDPPQDGDVTVIDVSKEDTFDTIFITVHGLTGGTVYDMEIIQVPSEIVIGRIKVCTTPTEANSKQPIAPPSRPLSPVTTLLDTLSQSQVTLSEVKNSMKRSRKEHAKKMNTIRNEVEQIRAKSENSDKTDERVRRKLLSLRSNVKQLENDIKAAEVEAQRVEQESKEYANEYAAQKQQWKEQMDLLEDRKQAEKAAKEEIEAQLAAIENERAAISNKREKLVTKKERLTGDISKIESDLDHAIEEELGRRKAAREGKMEHRKKLVDEFSSAITQMENGVNELKSRTHNIWVSYQTHQVPQGSSNAGLLEVPGSRSRNNSFSNLAMAPPQPPQSLDHGGFDFSMPNTQNVGTFTNGFFSGGPANGDMSLEDGNSSTSASKRLSIGST